MGKPFDPRTLVPRGSALQRRIVLAEILGPPRAQEPWRPLRPTPVTPPRKEED